jgi:hypothetical protein
MIETSRCDRKDESMKRRTSLKAALVGLVAILMLAIGTVSAGAQTPTPTPAPKASQGPRGVGGHKGGIGVSDELLARALGITVADLQKAYETARVATIEQAVKDGRLTRAQADQMIAAGARGRGPGGRFGHADDTALAAALGVTTSKLQAARTQAQDEALKQAVTDGRLTQAQADLIRAQAALKPYVDHDTLMAKVLGVSVDQLRAALQNQTFSKLLSDKGMTAAQARDAVEAARQAAVRQAVADGVITQAQADQLAQGKGFGLHDHGLRVPGGRGGPRGGQQNRPTAPAQATPTTKGA